MPEERSNVDLDRVAGLLQPISRPLTTTEQGPFVALLEAWVQDAMAPSTLWGALRQAHSLAVAMVASTPPASSTAADWSATMQLVPGLGSTLCVRRASDGAEIGLRLASGGQPCGAVRLGRQGLVASLEIELTAEGARLRHGTGDQERLLELGAVPAGCWTASPVSTPRLELAFVSGPAPFAPTTASAALLIGRGEGCGLQLLDPRASRRHARLEPVEGGFLLEDLGSGRGTYVNGQRVGDPVRVAAGDHLVIGETQIELRTPSCDADATLIQDAGPAPGRPAGEPTPPTVKMEGLQGGRPTTAAKNT